MAIAPDKEWAELEALVSPLPPWVGEAAEMSNGGVAPQSAGTSFTSNASGLAVHTRAFPAQANRKGVVFVVHGLNDHSSKHCYTVLCRRLASEGFEAHTMDMQGHGYSEGKGARQYVPDFLEVAADLEQMASEVMQRATSDGTRFFFVCHSTGGSMATLCSLKFVDEHPLASRYAGAYLLSPFLGFTVHTVPALVAGMLGFAARVGMGKHPGPKRRLTDTTPWVVYCHRKVYDIEFCKDALQWKEDPDGKIPLATLSGLLRLGATLRRRAREVQTPFRVVHGTGDVLVPMTGSLILRDESHYAIAASEPASERLWEIDSPAHLLLQTNVGPSVLDDMVSWLSGRLQRDA